MIYQQPVRYEYHLIRPPALLIVGEEDHVVQLGQYATPGSCPQSCSSETDRCFEPRRCHRSAVPLKRAMTDPLPAVTVGGGWGRHAPIHYGLMAQNMKGISFLVDCLYFG